MRVVCDLEANGLTPDKIWVICCIDVDTNERNIFHPYRSDEEASRFQSFANRVSLWIGHNFLNYDRRVLNLLVPGLHIAWGCVLDTLVVSRTVDATLDGHSLKDWGPRLGKEKAHSGIEDWSTFTPEMEERCISDTEINLLLYRHLLKFIDSQLWASALETEHYTAYLCSVLHDNGFSFHKEEAYELKGIIDKELEDIDKELKVFFLPKVSLVREVVPRSTKFGTIAKNSIPKALGSDFTPYTAGAPFSLIEYVPFNPRSHKQRIERLWEAGWKPVNKTKTHKDTEKAVQKLKRSRRYRGRETPAETALKASLGEYGVSGYGYYGWMTDEENLGTLPPSAPEAAQKLARYMLLASRSSMLQTWLDAVQPDGRIHGDFNHILPWTHRMSHANPNMGNIPKFDSKQPHKTPYSDRMRALWVAASGRYLVGVDAESIQLRIFGHYINDQTFIQSLIAGKKEDGTDPHSLNQKALGTICKSRDDAKTFIYAWLLGAGIEKVAAILGCSREEAERSCENFLRFYPGLLQLKEEVIPHDAAQGYFKGFDGRYVRIWGDDIGSRSHFALAGYLQCGEAVIMKRACQLWYPRLEREKIPFWFVNFVHDEFQIETIRDVEVAKYVAETVADAIRQVGDDLGLNCPMAGSYLGAGIPDLTDPTGKVKFAIGDNWMETH